MALGRKAKFDPALRRQVADDLKTLRSSGLFDRWERRALLRTKTNNRELGEQTLNHRKKEFEQWLKDNPQHQ